MLVTFGESLFRSVTHTGERLAQAQDLGFYLGGTELNVAANAAALGIPARWVSALPAGLTGDLIRERVDGLRVDTSFCIRAASARVGWYLMESGASPRPDIVYHRNASAMADETKLSFDWAGALKGASVFHTSGVTCGISQTLTDEITRLADVCEKSGVLFSYDCNLRKNIWSIEESIKRQKPFIAKARILFCSAADLRLFFGEDFETDHFKAVFAASKIDYLVMSQRSDDNREYGIEVVDRQGRKASKRHLVSQVDRIGVGDAATAGFFKVFLAQPKEIAHAADWAAWCGALKYGIKGDMALVQAHEIERILNSPQTGIFR